MIKFQPADESGEIYTSRKLWVDTSDINENERILAVADAATLHGVWKTASRASSGTTQVVLPRLPTSSLIITDIMLSGDKKSGSTITIRVTDGSNTEDVFTLDMTDASAFIAANFKGRIQTWAGARVDMETTATATVNMLIGYTHIPTGLPYAEWDARR